MSSTETQAAAPPEAADEPIIWRLDLRKRMGDVSSETIRVWIKIGKVPPPDYPLSTRTMGWRASTLRNAGLPF